VSGTAGNDFEVPFGAREFASTHWSVVVAASGADVSKATAALEQLCLTYWYPLYAYVRRRGFSPADAQDLVQSFFASLLEKNYFARADRNRGRFRTFLLSSIGNFLHNEWDRASAQKRGGGRELLSLEGQTSEERYANEPPDNASPETLFEKRWAATLLEQVLKKLRAQFVIAGRAELFDQLKPHLWGEDDATPYSELSEHLQMSLSAVKVTVHRLRQRYRELLRNEIAQTVADPSEVDDEIRHLIRVMAQ